MRVALSWLRTLCDPGLEPAALAERLTRQGLEVGAVVPVPAPSERIVAARLSETAPIARTNYRRIRADAGAAGSFVVVSAAPNVVSGMTAALALPGAHLPDGRIIAPRAYAGVDSEAMLCAEAEVGLGETSDRLLELPAGARPGTPLADLYGLPDICLEIELTPNRGDCLSMLGVAREVHAGTGAALQPPAIEPVAGTGDEAPEVRVEDAAACPRYVARYVEDLDPQARTPLWLRERLRRAGLRSTFPVVDVLNYVMLELGQPMHAFDRDRLHGPISVRPARPGESLVLLNGATASLAPDLLVIADGSGPVALAGIMGGAGSAVSAVTRRVMLESAYFAPDAVRGRARRLGLASEAAHRFERGVGAHMAQLALERASRLLGEIAGGRAGPVTEIRSASHLPARKPVFVAAGSVPRLTGMTPGIGQTQGILRRLGFAVAERENGADVTPPGFRFDIECEADIVEEVARIVGYDKIPTTAPARRAPRPQDEFDAATDRFAALLAARGYDESVTMSFADPERDEALAPPAAGAQLRLANPLAETQSVLRRSLWPGLVDALIHNAARQVERVCLFERGTVFDAGGEHDRLAGIATGPAAPEQWAVRARPVDFFDVKGDVEAVLDAARAGEREYRPGERAGLAPGRRACVVAGERVLAEFGVLAPELARRWGVPADTVLFEIDLEALPAPALPCAKPVPRFPSVRRDLALVVPKEISAATVAEAARRFGGPRLAEVRIFDIYAGSGIPSGTRSVGIGLIFRDLSRTLTDAEVDAAVSGIMTGLAGEMGAHVRT